MNDVGMFHLRNGCLFCVYGKEGKKVILSQFNDLMILCPKMSLCHLRRTSHLKDYLLFWTNEFVFIIITFFYPQAQPSKVSIGFKLNILLVLLEIISLVYSAKKWESHVSYPRKETNVWKVHRSCIFHLDHSLFVSKPYSAIDFLFKLNYLIPITCCLQLEPLLVEE